MRLLTSSQLQVPSVGAIAFAHNRNRNRQTRQIIIYRHPSQPSFTWGVVNPAPGFSAPLVSGNSVTMTSTRAGGLTSAQTVGTETYVEFSVSGGVGSQTAYGVRDSTAPHSFQTLSFPSIYAYHQDGSFWRNGVRGAGYGRTFSVSGSAPDLVGMHFNRTTGELRFNVNGVWQGSLSIPVANYFVFLYAGSSQTTDTTYRLASASNELVYGL